MGTITVRVTRPLHLDGRRVEAGSTLKLTALQASDALHSGRAELLHLPDLAQCHAAIRADTTRLLRESGATRIGAAPDPWRPLI